VCVLVCEYTEKGIKKTRQTPTQEYNRKGEIDVLGRRRGIRIQVQKEKSRRKRRRSRDKFLFSTVCDRWTPTRPRARDKHRTERCKVARRKEPSWLVDAEVEP